MKAHQPVSRETDRPEVVTAIRSLIEAGVYLPGQALRQEELAAHIGVSRVPVREALQLLLAEGIVRHTPNSGFTVARLTVSELQQVYVMRRHVETRVLKSIKPEQVTPELLDQLRAVNEEMRQHCDDRDVTHFQRLNHDFHATMFQVPRLEVFEDQISRLWRISGPYRSVWAADINHRRMVTSEHQSMIDALAAQDLDRLCALMDVHRGTTATDVGQLLTRR
jgi:DNA-binding GntR family transcriptional regulator